jgi:hypothetical protein
MILTLVLTSSKRLSHNRKYTRMKVDVLVLSPRVITMAAVDEAGEEAEDAAVAMTAVEEAEEVGEAAVVVVEAAAAVVGMMLVTDSILKTNGMHLPTKKNNVFEI